MTRYYPTDAAIERIGLGLLDRSLPKPEWTHAAHFAATLWLLRDRPQVCLPERLPGLIRAYNKATGVENTDTAGYHETVTQASIRAARDFLGRYPAERPLHEIHDELMASRLGDKAWLLDYWSRVRVNSVEARRGWVGPDLKDLPF
jgi:hypothetical protein